MIELRDYQKDAVESIFDYFTEKGGNPILALPTGTGKSILIAEFIRRVLSKYPKQRIMMITHVKELIAQNLSALLKVWPSAPVGIYSAGLNRKDNFYPITFAGIASVAKKADLFAKQDLILIDECHLVSARSDTMYLKFLKILKEKNPALKIIGFTATQYRLGQGLLTDGKIFTDVCFDLTKKDCFQKLVAEGFMSPLVTKKTLSELDVSGVKIQAGEYVLKDLQKAVNKDEITRKALNEALLFGKDRKSWLIFTTGIEHAERTAALLNEFGVRTAAVHSKISSSDRDQIIRDFKSGYYQAVTNNNVLTTGFDFPGIDMILVLRPTNSTGLWVQLLGRGTRPAPGKKNCLVMDFAGNTRRLGPIDDPVIPGKKKKKGDGTAPVKECPICQTYQHISVKFCKECGFDFPQLPKIYASAASQKVMSRDDIEVCFFEIENVTYKRHKKIDKPDSLKITYHTDEFIFNEWICLEHSGFAKRKAKDFWKAASGESAPESIDEALSKIDQLRVPTGIKVWIKDPFPEVLAKFYRD